ncbi:Homeodomain-like protein [Artemisia annua]|uniref:Homeodomain-like protein n=1 Tax=Artemisia annua TaxID=35608 RepID=A0A2U1MX63_ARTAN|nr:Homeodomain-like protein [Artemisia annua]
MDVIQPRMDEEDALDLPIQPSFRETGIRLHHSNPYTLQLTCKIGFVDFHPFVNICSPINLMSKGSYTKIFKKEIEYLGNNFLGEVKNVSVFVGTYTFLVDFMIFDNVTEFVESGLEEIILGKPFQDFSWIKIDTHNGVVWLPNENDVTIFKMPRVVENFKHWNRKQLSRAKPLLDISNKDKENGYDYAYQKIKDFYKGCLDLGDAYKRDERVIDMLGRNHKDLEIVKRQKMVKISCYDQNGVKKGAWSEEEDNKLRAYIQRYGHWNWGLLPKFAGRANYPKESYVKQIDPEFEVEAGMLLAGVSSSESPLSSSHTELLSCQLICSDYDIFSDITPQTFSDELVGNFWSEPFPQENDNSTPLGHSLLSPCVTVLGDS